jgi:uncharacterized RDD family membrane protein YckC
MNEQEPHYAGFWRRNAAYVIDYFVISIFLLILLLSVAALGFWSGLHNHLGVIDQVNQLEIWINIFLGLSLLLYFAGMESSAKQATLGKMAAGLVVTDLQGERLTFLRAVGRNLAKFLSALVLGIGFLMAAFTKRKQGLHDKAAGALVVKQNKSRVFKVLLLIFLFGVIVIGGLGYFVYVTILPQLVMTAQETQISGKSLETPSGVSSLEKTLSSKESAESISTGTQNKIESDGSSSITYADGSSYVGDVFDGAPQGHGTYTYANGDKYVGQFKSFLFDGRGSYFYASGNKYVGEWKDDKQDGQGTFTWANGDQYVGEFKEGQRHGQGALTWVDGTKLVGEWENGKHSR